MGGSRRLFTLVAVLVAVLVLGSAAASSCGPTTIVLPDPTPTSTTVKPTTTTVPKTTTTKAPTTTTTVPFVEDPHEEMISVAPNGTPGAYPNDAILGAAPPGTSRMSADG